MEKKLLNQNQFALAMEITRQAITQAIREGRVIIKERKIDPLHPVNILFKKNVDSRRYDQAVQKKARAKKKGVAAKVISKQTRRNDETKTVVTDNVRLKEKKNLQKPLPRAIEKKIKLKVDKNGGLEKEKKKREKEGKRKEAEVVESMTSIEPAVSVEYGEREECLVKEQVEEAILKESEPSWGDYAVIPGSKPHAELQRINEQIVKLKIDNAKELKEFIVKDKFQEAIGKISAVIRNHIFPLGDRLSPILAGICKITKPEKILKIKTEIDEEVERALVEVKREAKEYLREMDVNK